MRNSKTIVGIILVIAILLIAVGYAAIGSRELNISGEVTAKPDDKNFIVRFIGTPDVSDKQKVKATIVDDLNATINVEGLTAKGDIAWARYTVRNESADISAELTAEITENTNEEYFDVSYEIEEPTVLKAKESTTVMVRVELLKTPILNNVTATIKAVVTAKPKQPEIATPPEVSSDDGIRPIEIFDKNGTNPEGLHIGDFVNYDAGTWTAEEIQALNDAGNNVSGSAELPTENFQFGGFTAGSSRNGNATPGYTYTSGDKIYGDYVRDASTGDAKTGDPITGWRVFDVEGDKVTLISAGCPEDFYVPSWDEYDKKGGWISEYILTGNVNSNWTDGVTESASYQRRTWNNYVNSTQKAEKAELLTFDRLESWYSKYITTGADIRDIDTFQMIYQEPYTRYQNVIDNWSAYWLAAAYHSDYVFSVIPDRESVNIIYGQAFGVRPLVSLSSDVKFTATKTGTKTVTGGNMDEFGGDQTYNCWNIK